MTDLAHRLQPEPFRVIVCGSRTFPTPSWIIPSVLKGLLGELITPPWIIEGGCPTGADAAARDVADDEGWPITTHYPEWDKLGKAAGPVRNQEMLDTGADMVIAFIDKPLAASRGTRDMVGRARNAGIATLVLEFTQQRFDEEVSS